VTTSLDIAIDEVSLPASGAIIDGLASLLVDAVASGASVSFLGQLSLDEARAWWMSTLAAFGPRDVLLVARDAQGSLVGTVNVRACWQPNQQFRGEITKLLVDRRARGQGVAGRLMSAIEEKGRRQGLSLLVLDTVAGSTADRLYQRLGWSRVGEIPDYCLLPDGSFGATAIFFKKLTAARDAQHSG
jgi:GNAT superfamily N-acetyltransferase